MVNFFCIPLNDYESLFINSLIHILILSVVLTIFFFIVISKLETKELTNQIINIVSKSIKNADIPRNEMMSQNLHHLASLYKNKNEADVIYNNSLFYICIGFITIVGITFLTLVLTLKLSSKKCTNIFNVILENILLFICVGIVEYLFFINIGLKFVPILPSYLNKVINDNI